MKVQQADGSVLIAPFPTYPFGGHEPSSGKAFNIYTNFTVYSMDQVIDLVVGLADGHIYRYRYDCGSISAAQDAFAHLSYDASLPPGTIVGGLFYNKLFRSLFPVSKTLVI
jgi:hypothetical protein